MKIQLRELVDKSVKMLEEFFMSFCTFEELIEQLAKEDEQR